LHTHTTVLVAYGLVTIDSAVLLELILQILGLVGLQVAASFLISRFSTHRSACIFLTIIAHSLARTLVDRDKATTSNRSTAFDFTA